MLLDAGRERCWYRALAIAAIAGMAMTVAAFTAAAIDPAAVRPWLPLFGPLAGVNTAISFGIVAHAIQARQDQGRAARAAARMAAEPELAARLAAQHAALLYERDERA
jgi:hypothetical protein